MTDNSADTTALIKAQDNDKRPEKAPLSVGLPVFICVLVLLSYAGYWAKQWLEDEQRLPVQEIIFSGNLNYLDENDLAALIKKELTSSFFALDVNEVHALMERQEWVYTASIRKRWPSKLYIHIIEQKVVARWNDDLLLNQYGETFDGDNLLGENKNTLPQLFGPGGSEKTVLTGYTYMQRLLNASGLKINQLVLSERFAWQTKLNNNLLLKLGRQEYVNRLQRFIDVFPLLEQEERTAEYVDLRYDTGLAVGWLSPDSPNASNNNNS